MTISAVTATVEAVDLATRMVTLVGPDGKSFVVQAGEQVRNLDQVKVGDKVTVEYYEGLLAEIAPAGASPSEVKMTECHGQGGAWVSVRPARWARRSRQRWSSSMSTRIRNVVHFKGPLGKTRIVKVMKPEFRTMLKNLKPGDQVALSYFEAMAVSVKPASN